MKKSYYKKPKLKTTKIKIGFFSSRGNFLDPEGLLLAQYCTCTDRAHPAAVGCFPC